MENVIKYFESLEQRLAALEAAAKTDAALEAAQETVIAGLHAKIEELEAKIAELEARPAAAPVVETEPEVEVELVFDEEEPEAPETPEEPEEPVVPEIPEEQEPIVEEQPKVEPEAEPKAAFSAQVGAPVDDIRKAISIGDRFLFIRELFGGNGEALQKTIDELNKLSSLEEAEALVRKRFHWDEESAAAQLFMNILKRRFS